mmetsp:Transcript_10959/g.30018  ORF Transcript_10959/g.30018 Transcript_10959/m.30018 type:complete len:132 (+) Transcript_10959:261-656(+)
MSKLTHPRADKFSVWLSQDHRPTNRITLASSNSMLRIQTVSLNTAPQLTLDGLPPRYIQPARTAAKPPSNSETEAFAMQAPLVHTDKIAIKTRKFCPWPSVHCKNVMENHNDGEASTKTLHLNAEERPANA